MSSDLLTGGIVPLANLYLDKVDLSGYLNKNCAQCGFPSCSEFIRVGPACAAGLPIFLSEIWAPPEG